MRFKNMLHFLNKPLAVGIGAIAATEVAEQTINTVEIDANPAQAVHIIVQIIIGIATLIKMFKKQTPQTDEKKNS